MGTLATNGYWVMHIQIHSWNIAYQYYICRRRPFYVERALLNGLMSFNAHQITFRGTISNTFSESTKAIHMSFIFARYFSCSRQTMEIASFCHARPCHKSKLQVVNFHNFSRLTFSDTFQNGSINRFHKRFAHVRATSQHIQFTFVDIHQLTLSSVLWYSFYHHPPQHCSHAFIHLVSVLHQQPNPQLLSYSC